MGENANSTPVANETQVEAKASAPKQEKKPAKKSWWKGLKAEFSKIVWPSKATLTKETVAVCFYAALLAVFIAGFDFVLELGLDKLISWK